MQTAEKLTALRARMREAGMYAYVVASGDAHQSEYVTEYWRARAWITGFTGSNGLAVVTMDEAGLWTDGRYFIQAERQLSGSGITLFKMNEPGVPDYLEWLAGNLPESSLVGFDGRTFSVTEFDKIKKALPTARFSGDSDLVGEIWHDRPSMPNDPAFEHAPHFAGASRTEKLQAVRDAFQKKGADACLLTALDDIAWLLNIRGRDIPQTPVVYAYVLVTVSDAHVFIKPEKLDNTLAGKLESDGYTLHPYDEIFACLRALKAGCKLLYDASRVNIRLAEAVADTVKVIRESDTVALLKAAKSDTEISNIRNAHLKEGVVMARFLKRMDEWAADENRETLTEADLHGMITHFREEQDSYLEPSFDTIAAYGENAASMHYSPVKGACAEIKPEGFLLVDTGGQYLDGTTDITRTIVMGSVTDEMKRDYTLVLKGHIALATAVFPAGTTGAQLDALARVPLWAAGINYRSGTGHGLGYCLGVHEGPQNISTRPNAVKLTAGMLCTNEPGVYKEGRYGIRTENVLLVTEMFTSEDGAFMGFETISYCPVDVRALDISLLTSTEIKWLDDYHQRVFEIVSPHLREDEQVWLRNATRQLNN